MKLIGYWMRNLNDTELPLPQELAGELPTGVREAVCKHLGRGEIYEVYRGYSWCRLRCGVEDREMGFREYTDGEWIWPECLVHYVHAHGILLPEEFIACATSVRSPRPDNDRSPSLEFWISWAKTRQSPSIRRLLNEKLVAARAAEVVEINNLVAEIRQRETESSAPCIFAGCSEPALTGCRICARHSISENQIYSRTAHLFRLPREI
jgi:hypothetical protein